MLFAVIIMVRPARAAETYFTASGGFTKFNMKTTDGFWCQAPFPCARNSTSTVWTAGLGLKLNEHWSIEADYRSLGKQTINSSFVDDFDYDPVNHRCISNCDSLFTINGSWKVAGPSVSGVYSYPFPLITPYVRAGILFWQNSGTVLVSLPKGYGDPFYPVRGAEACTTCKTDSLNYAGMLGVGLRVEKWERIQPFGEFTYYRAVGGGEAPSKSALTVQGGLRIPF